MPPISRQAPFGANVDVESLDAVVQAAADKANDVVLNEGGEFDRDVGSERRFVGVGGRVLGEGMPGGDAQHDAVGGVGSAEPFAQIPTVREDARGDEELGRGARFVPEDAVPAPAEGGAADVPEGMVRDS